MRRESGKKQIKKNEILAKKKIPVGGTGNDDVFLIVYRRIE